MKTKREKIIKMLINKNIYGLMMPSIVHSPKDSDAQIFKSLLNNSHTASKAIRERITNQEKSNSRSRKQHSEIFTFLAKVGNKKRKNLRKAEEVRRNKIKKSPIKATREKEKKKKYYFKQKLKQTK